MALNFAFATLFLIVYLTFVILFLMHATLYLITRLHISQCDFRFRSCDIRNHNVFISRYVNLYLAVATLFLKTDFQLSIMTLYPATGALFLMHATF